MKFLFPKIRRPLLPFLFTLLFLAKTVLCGTDKLTPPEIRANLILEKVTCIRPHREGLFKIGIEKKGHRWIIHDYGHGGAGWTLVFGSVERSIALFEKTIHEDPIYQNKPIPPIRVIGAGAHGLLTAIELTLKGYDVRGVAKDFDELTSHKGAGIFAPGPMNLLPEEQQELGEVSAASYTAWASVAKGTHPYIKTGATALPLYIGEGTDSGLLPLVRQGVIPEGEPVSVDFGNGKIHSMKKYSSFFMDTRAVLSQLHKKADELNLFYERKEITDFEQIAEEIVFDCTGLGSGKLNQDSKVIPVQGHLITLRDQPKEAFQYMVYAKLQNDQDYCYWTPKGGGTLGGSYIKGEDSLSTNQDQHNLIFQHAADFFGSPRP